MDRKQLNLNLLVFGVLILFIPRFSFAQSTILATPDFPDIFASLESRSDFFSILLIFTALTSLLLGPITSKMHYFTLPFLKKPKRVWGIIYNSITKQRMKNVIINLYKKNGNNVALSKKQKSGTDGSFGFDTPHGEYKISLAVKNYVFPSKFIKGKKDGKLDNIYHGEVFFITSEEDSPTINIPLDPLFLPKLSYEAKLHYYSKRIGVPLLFLGTFFALYSLYYFPSQQRLIITAVYAIIWFLVILTLYLKTSGLKVISYENRTPVEQAIVKLINIKTHKSHIYITDQIGKVTPDIPDGKYKLIVHRPGYNSINTNIEFQNRVSLKQITVKI